jgi:hypothetical protein
MEDKQQIILNEILFKINCDFIYNKILVESLVHKLIARENLKENTPTSKRAI